MAALEGRKVKHGTSWRVYYYFKNVRKLIVIGVTSKTIALQRRAQIEASLAMGIDHQARNYRGCP